MKSSQLGPRFCFVLGRVLRGVGSPVLVLAAALLASPVLAQDTLVVEGGNVGIGTSTPSETLHLLNTDDATGARFLIEDTGTGFANKTGFRLRSANAPGGADWGFEVNAAGNFIIDFLPSVNAELAINANPNGNGTVRVFGNLVVEGTCIGCDAVFEADFPLESIQDHAQSMWLLGHLPAVGPTPDGETPIDVYEKVTGMLQELEKAHVYIEQLQQRLEQQGVELEQLREAVAARD